MGEGEPRAATVVVLLACFSTPRATMHMWRPSTTTRTPLAPDTASIAAATCTASTGSAIAQCAIR